MAAGNFSFRNRAGRFGKASRSDTAGRPDEPRSDSEIVDQLASEARPSGSPAERARSEKPADPDAVAPKPKTKDRARAKAATGTGAKPDAEAGQTRRPVPLGLEDARAKVRGAHIILATVSRSPIFKLSDQECDEIAHKVVDVSRHFNLRILADSPTGAIVALGFTSGMIYVGHAWAMAQAKAAAQPMPAAAPSSPETAAATATVIRPDFTGDHLAGVRVP